VIDRLVTANLDKEDDVERTPHLASLELMPTEMLLDITSYLSPSSLMSVCYSSRHIRNLLGILIEDVLGKISHCPDPSALEPGSYHLRQECDMSRQLFEPLGGSRLNPPCSEHFSERLELLCMLERDGLIHCSKSICSVCADVHDRSLFFKSSLTQLSKERRCIGATGKSWVYPHWIIGHEEILAPENGRKDHGCGSKRVPVLRGETAPLIRWPIMLIDGPLPSDEQVTETLRALTAAICPHWRLNDTFVSRCYSRHCLKSHQIWHWKKFLCIADVQHARWTPTYASNVELLWTSPSVEKEAARKYFMSTLKGCI